MHNLVSPVLPSAALVAFVTESLKSAGHPRPSDWERFLDPRFVTAPTDAHKIFHLNVALSEIIGMLPEEVNTLGIRLSLDDRVSVEDWKVLFTKGALPCLLKYELPLTTS